MKILFISDVHFPRINGVSTSIETFRSNLHSLGHTVHLIAPDYCATSTDETGILRVPARRMPLDPEDRFMSYRWVMNQLNRLRIEQYNIIHVQTPFVAHYLGVRLSCLLDIPCVETYHTFFEEYLYHYVPLVPKWVTRLLAKRFSRHQGNSLDGIVVPSKPIFVFSSRTETQGLVLLEAMAQGLPVISTAELGTRDVLSDGHGAWIAQEEVADFSTKIVKLLVNARARSELGDAGRDYASEWSADTQAHRMLGFYRSVLGQFSTNPATPAHGAVRAGLAQAAKAGARKQPLTGSRETTGVVGAPAVDGARSKG